MERDEMNSRINPSDQIGIGRSWKKGKGHLRREHKCRKSSRKKSTEFLLEKLDRVRRKSHELREENENLKGDISLLKNLVYNLNLELEKHQMGGGKRGGDFPQAGKIQGKLPKNCEKNFFLKPVLPLLKAYSESILEKEETIEELIYEFEKFGAAFGGILKENEKLYGELEKKFDFGNEEIPFCHTEILKKDLEMAKSENELLRRQIKLEKNKMERFVSAFKFKVEEGSEEKEKFKCDLEECRSDLLMTRGKYSILKQEFDRLKTENETRIPEAVHSASVNECRKLFQVLKAQYESEKCRLVSKIENLEANSARHRMEEEKWRKEKVFLERIDRGRRLEIDNLTRKILDCEIMKTGNGDVGTTEDKKNKEVLRLRKRLGEANEKIERLSKHLVSARKNVQKAMVFAEEMVQDQESLLLRLHEKQKENGYLNAQFGSLKIQLKDVERGAQKGLNSIELKMKSLESDNRALSTENRKLTKLLEEKENLIKTRTLTKKSIS